MRKRLVVLFGSLLFAFSGIIARVFRLTEQGYNEVAQAQSTVTLTVAQARGTLYDCRLQPLTNAGTRYASGVVGTPAALAALADTLPKKEFDTLQASLSSGKPAALVTDTSPALTDGIMQFTVPRRYDKEGLAAHLIGYVGDDGVHGVCGAEQALDEVLCAASGSVTLTYRTDGRGQVLSGGEVLVDNTLDAARAGAALTIDSRIQRMVEAVAGSAISRGAVVISEVDTGNLVALASFPSFTAENLAVYLNKSDSPLFNRATAAYNCGSVFKIVTAMAALECGVPATQTFPCAGVIPVGSNRIKCHYILGHGTLDLLGAFAKSCNPYFIQLSQLTSASPLYRYASMMGFDSPLLLTEGWLTDRATLPTETELTQPTRLANTSMGQGDLLATPVHVNAMTACVANNGMYHRPNVYLGTVDVLGTLKEEQADPPSRICSPATAAALREMMRRVVTDGTGKDAEPAVGGAGGKTGTAETGWRTEDGKETMVHSWFTGYYPESNPQYAITVLAEDADTTGEATAPVFKELCDRLYRMGCVEITS